MESSTFSKEQEQIEGLLTQQFNMNCIRTDRMFLSFIAVQWILAIAYAGLFSASNGATNSVAKWQWVALFGFVVVIPSAWLALWHVGRLGTRIVIAISQASFSGLFIYLMDGRSEAYFHLFIAMALIATYRSPVTIVPFVVVALIDQWILGPWILAEQRGRSITHSDLENWRSLELTAWVLIEAIALLWIIHRNREQTSFLARLQNSLVQEKRTLDAKFVERSRELEEARMFQEQVLNSIDAMVCIISADGTIWFMNKNWKEFAQRYLGRDNVGVGTNYFEALTFLRQIQGAEAELPAPTEIEHTEFKDAIQDIVTGTRPSYTTEQFLDLPDGRICLQSRASRVPSSGKVLVALVHMDVTEVKEAQSRVASLAKIILESPNEVFLFRCDDLKYVEVNQGACANLLYTREELLTLSPTAVCVQVEESKLRGYINSLLDGTSKFVEFETSLQRKDGTHYQCHVRLHRCQFDDADAIMAFVTDLTQHKHLEAKLAQAQKMESLGQLAAGIAHEINTPMQCVFGNVEFLQSSMEQLFSVTDACIHTLEQSEVTREAQSAVNELRKQLRFDHVRKQFPLAIDEASDASKRVISIVRAMKIMSHPGTATMVDTELHKLIRNTATITQNRWKYVARMSFAFDSRVTTIPAFPAELSQVFINIFVNASDAIAEKIGPEPTELGTILVNTSLEDDTVAITISDSGCGMTEEIKKKIFDPFFTTKDVGKGTGQGLAISYDVIVNKHGGSIDVTSKPGLGTRFLLRLPLEAARPSVSDDLAVPVFELNNAELTRTPSTSGID